MVAGERWGVGKGCGWFIRWRVVACSVVEGSPGGVLWAGEIMRCRVVLMQCSCGVVL